MKKIFAACIATLSLANPAWAGDINKIASAGGDITEILFEFGVGDKVVAVDTTSIYPESVKALPKIGYVRELSAEGVLGTGADLLIGSWDMGAPAAMENLKAAGMRVEYTPNGEGAQRYADKVNHIGQVLDMPERAAQMISAYDDALAQVNTRKQQLAKTPRVLLILSVRGGAPIAAGTGTTGNDIIALSGGENVASFEGWKGMNSEAIIAAAPDIIVLSDSHMQRLGGAEVVMSRPDIGKTPAGKKQNFVLLNAQMMLQFGPRSTAAMNQLMTAYEGIK